MDGKIVTVAVYLVLVTLVIASLLLSLFRPPPLRAEFHIAKQWIVLLFLTAIVFLAHAAGTINPYLAGTAILAAVLTAAWSRLSPPGSPITRMATLTSVFVLATGMTWWLRDSASPRAFEWACIAAPLAMAGIYLLWHRQPAASAGQYPALSWTLSLLFLLACLFFFFSPIFYRIPSAALNAWHHWGAYVGPAQLMHKGLVPLYDFPVQYGLGPTTLLSLSCGSSCWQAMYWVAGITGLIHAMALFCAARLVLPRSSSRIAHMLLAGTLFALTFVWTGSPAHLGSPSITPSVSGLRFMPLSLLLVSILARPQIVPGVSTTVLSFATWLLGLWWSPEAAYQTTLVWVPYYVWSRTISQPADASRTTAMLKAIATVMIVLASAVVAMLAIYAMIYGRLPSLSAYLVYVLYPPGPMPVDTHGAVWFFLLIVIVGVCALHSQLRREPKSIATSRILPTLLAALAVASYYLGRSHDNNLLNISIYFGLLCVALKNMPAERPERHLAVAILSAFLAYSVTANGGYWRQMITQPHAQPDRIAAVISHWRYDTGNAQLPEDIRKAAQYVQANYGEPATVIDPWLLDASSDASAWNALNGPENYYYVPAVFRRLFLQRSATRLPGPGWLIVRDSPDTKIWIDDFRTAYTEDQRIPFGAYYAIRFTSPRLPTTNRY